MEEAEEIAYVETSAMKAEGIPDTSGDVSDISAKSETSPIAGGDFADRGRLRSKYYIVMMEVTIRKAEDSDMESIHGLVRELAEYEKGLHRVITTGESYLKDFQENVFDAFVAIVDGEIVGMALYYMNFSTWRGKMMYLEDFIVKESMRGHGIGKLLFEAFLEESKQQDCTMVKWQVLDWNEPAINFYRKYDVVFDKEWIDCKVYFGK